MPTAIAPCPSFLVETLLFFLSSCLPNIHGIIILLYSFILWAHSWFSVDMIQNGPEKGIKTKATFVKCIYIGRLTHGMPQANKPHTQAVKIVLEGILWDNMWNTRKARKKMAEQKPCWKMTSYFVGGGVWSVHLYIIRCLYISGRRIYMW